MACVCVCAYALNVISSNRTVYICPMENLVYYPTRLIYDKAKTPNDAVLNVF
jgi:hypothetical protein